MFVADDRLCRNFAAQSIGMVAGTAICAGQASLSGGEAQRRYDIAYQQCMYAKGNQLPGNAYRYRATPLPPQTYPYPPPPPPPR